MSDGITIDLREFDRALRQHAAAADRALDADTNKQAGNLAMRAAQYSPKADKASIARVGDWHQTPWWPAFIQKVLKVSGVTINYRRRVSKKLSRKVRGMAFDALATPGERAAWLGQTTYGEQITHGPDEQRREVLRRISKRIIARRINTVGSFKAIFSEVANRFGVHTSRAGSGGKIITPGAAKVRLANPSNYMAEFSFSFSNTKSAWPGGTRPSATQDVSAKQAIAYDAMMRALPFVIADMRKHAERTLKREGAKISAA